MMVTCVIPHYNEPRERLIATVASARAAGIEHIVVSDDASDDVVILDNVHTTVSAVNKGCAAALNAGISRAVDGWIVRLDCGDLLEPNKLEQIAEAETAGAVATFSDAIDLLSGRSYEAGDDWATRIYTDAQFVSSTTAFKKLVWEAVRFDETLRYFDDWDHMVRVQERFGWHRYRGVTARVACHPGGITDKGKDSPRRHADRARVFKAAKRMELERRLP